MGLRHNILRFKTNPDIAGTERLAVSQIRPELASTHVPKLALHAVCPHAPSDSLGPMSVFMVKGWSRALGAVCCMLHAYEEEEAFKAGATDFPRLAEVLCLSF